MHLNSDKEYLSESIFRKENIKLLIDILLRSAPDGAVIEGSKKSSEDEKEENSTQLDPTAPSQSPQTTSKTEREEIVEQNEDELELLNIRVYMFDNCLTLFTTGLKNTYGESLN